MPEFTYRPLAYTAPSGTRLEFVYNGSLEDGLSHDLGEFRFANTDEKYFQDRSQSSDSFAFTVMLNSQDQLSEIRELFNEKATPGNTGILEHPDPTLGSFPVVVSSYKVSQQTVRGIGVIRIDVIFFKTIPNLLAGDVSESTNPASAAASFQAINNLNQSQAQDFANGVSDQNGSAIAALVRQSRGVAEAAQAQLSALAAQAAEIELLFSTAINDFLEAIDQLARAPFDMARQIQNFVQLPMLAVESQNARATAYQAFISGTTEFSETDENEFDTGTPAGKNILLVSGVAATAGISALNYSAVSSRSATVAQIRSGEELPTGGYLSRRDIINTILQVQDEARAVTEILSEKAANFGAVSFFDQYFDYSILNKNLITATVRNLNQRIYNTAQEKIFVTDRAENIVPLCARIYNSVAVNTLEFFAQSNELHGDELYLVPANREIVYYE